MITSIRGQMKTMGFDKSSMLSCLIRVLQDQTNFHDCLLRDTLHNFCIIPAQVGTIEHLTIP